MPAITNGRHLFNEVPKGLPEAGKTTVYDSSQTIDIDNVPLNGGFILKTLTLSIDPFIRGKMLAPSSNIHIPLFTVGRPLHNYGVGVVVRSENADVEVGEHIYGVIDFQEYNIISDLKGLRKLPNEKNLPWSAYVGVAGMAGQTGYMGWKEYAKPEKGDTVFVSTGAGAVGSMVIQLAKRDGLKVIGSAGSDEKVQFMKDIGADVAFNYKTTKVADVLAKEGPINIYWDNVGGETLEAALANAALGARFIECGMLATLSSGPAAPGLKGIFLVIAKAISMNGFHMNRLYSKYEEEFYTEVTHLLATGEIKYKEDVTKGLDKVCEPLVALLKGGNTGKSIILVAEN